MKLTVRESELIRRQLEAEAAQARAELEALPRGAHLDLRKHLARRLEIFEGAAVKARDLRETACLTHQRARPPENNRSKRVEVSWFDVVDLRGRQLALECPTRAGAERALRHVRGAVPSAAIREKWAVFDLTQTRDRAAYQYLRARLVMS